MSPEATRPAGPPGAPPGPPGRLLRVCEGLRRGRGGGGTLAAPGATLAKSQEDRRVFELVFERFVFRAVELAATREGIREEELAALGELSEEELDALRAEIAQALRDGSEGAMRDLARMAIAAFARRQEGSGVIGVDVQRIRRALGLRAEPQPELP